MDYVRWKKKVSKENELEESHGRGRGEMMRCERSFPNDGTVASIPIASFLGAKIAEHFELRIGQPAYTKDENFLSQERRDTDTLHEKTLGVGGKTRVAKNKFTPAGKSHA
ncbi:hypothetical protein ZHAS_00000326 [Anopheles sinensis]|uniref:Uncharacterized protein n=1 Tax=Anopheles sinensis TaxID=74873 RepID=A0A084VA32_ANOSI|nr:hypothetical protein ZHAS_00000326 [Anopheles sinensis]